MGQYTLNVDKSGRFTLPVEVRKHELPGSRLAVYVGVPSIPGNEDMLSPGDLKCLKLITESKYNELVAKTENLHDVHLKRDMQAYLRRYSSLQPVNSRGRIVLPESFLKDVLSFVPPGRLEFLVMTPGKAHITTAVLLREAESKTMEKLRSQGVNHNEL